ncbi:MAG TPA: FAD-dependent oxidoreductase [Candidatus Levybacteria bacterium]|nr:FAD-dependent oxidoreductase [Candidatus Levybacteria bacterium]
MKIGIIGAGFTGLAAGYYLQQKGHDVTIIEKDSHPGGLAIGYTQKDWDWTLEHHYHHWFTNDDAILCLAKEIGYPVVIKRPKTSVYIQNQLFQLDSPIKLLRFPKLSLFERLRMAGVFALLFRLNPFWKSLENIKVTKALPRLIGKKAYTIIWEPQLINKMGTFVDQISLVWFWARIKKRTTSLAYPEKGFLPFATSLSNLIVKNGGAIHYTAETKKIVSQKNKRIVTILHKGKEEKLEFDRVIVTLPTHLFTAITPDLPESYLKTLAKLQGLGATNMVLRLKKPLLTDGTYWLSICDTNSHIMVVVEHTNFMDKSHYNNEHLVYIGNYMPTYDKKFTASKEDLFKLYSPLLKKLNPEFEKSLIGYEVFRAPFAQPIVPANYSRMIPAFTTPLQGVYLANMQQVYPWDRGTNYAVELGKKIADTVDKQ